MNPYDVLIRQRDPPFHSALGTLDEKAPTPSEGGGGWEPVQIPGRSDVLIWRRRGLMRMSFGLRFDGVNDGTRVTGTWLTLLHFWRYDDAHGQPVEPSVCRIVSPGDVVPYQELDWVVEDIEWGELIADDGGWRVQQQVGVVLREYRADERLKTLSTTKKKAPSRQRSYVVQTGDRSLTQIAERFKVGADSKHPHGSWRALGNAQKPRITDPGDIHLGQRLVIP